MPEYDPPPASLDHLNPIQRYLQKGSLEFEDYVRLGLVVLAYFFLRPYIDAAFKKFFTNGDLKEGEETQKEYIESKLRPKVGANAIRGVKADPAAAGLGSKPGATTSGSDVKQENAATSRKSKQLFGGKSQLVPEELLEWDGEPERKPVEGDKTDVMTWLNKWDE